MSSVQYNVELPASESGKTADSTGRLPHLATEPRITETEELFAATRRILHALSRRVAEADLEALAELTTLRDELDGCILEAIAGLRNDPELPASWDAIGRALGVTRRQAIRRYAGKVGGCRRPGGQPGHWR